MDDNLDRDFDCDLSNNFRNDWVSENPLPPARRTSPTRALHMSDPFRLFDCTPTSPHPIPTGHVDLSITHQPGHGSPFYTHRYDTPSPARTVRGPTLRNRTASHRSVSTVRERSVSTLPSIEDQQGSVSTPLSTEGQQETVSTLPSYFTDQQEGARTHQNLASGAPATRQLGALVDPLYHRFAMKEG